MNTPRPLSLLIALVLTATAGTAAAADGTAKGNVNYDDMTWPVADVLAYTEGDDLMVAFSEVKLDRADVAKDGKIDTFDFMGNDGGSITLRIDSENRAGCLNFTSGSGGGSSCNSDYADRLHVTSRTAERIAGSFDFVGEDGSKSTVTFDAPIAVDGKIARPGTALPADGGEPGKAVMAHFGAIASGDFAKLKAVSHPERVAQMEASEKEGQAKEMFEFIRAMTPTGVKVTGGTIDGDNAMVDFTATEDGKPIKGTAEVTRFEGKWYVAGTSTSN